MTCLAICPGVSVALPEWTEFFDRLMSDPEVTGWKEASGCIRR
ncbi:hypothetical protein GGR01_002349 [Acetobacter oeni]|nr:hypothetical protein [Acetobacter oeni]